MDLAVYGGGDGDGSMAMAVVTPATGDNYSIRTRGLDQGKTAGCGDNISAGLLRSPPLGIDIPVEVHWIILNIYDLVNSRVYF
ncbi:hypothetical protein RIF29_19964 [Crotalaria pallida]|uniref:Uncharacterized protein n=1 Tax=Crotalaria pallida TaxID=3830 RepID=A0AAN9I874_CROPI